MEDVISLSENDLKALSGSQRLKIIRSIAHKPKTPSDIAVELRKSTPTIIEHLNLLMLNGFVVKLSASDRKYVFYTLSEKGKSIFERSKKITIIFPMAIVLILISVAMIFSNLIQQPSNTVASASPISGAQSPQQGFITDYLGSLVSVAMLAAGVITFVFYLTLRRKLSAAV